MWIDKKKGDNLKIKKIYSIKELEKEQSQE